MARWTKRQVSTLETIAQRKTNWLADSRPDSPSNNAGNSAKISPTEQLDMLKSFFKENSFDALPQPSKSDQMKYEGGFSPFLLWSYLIPCASVECVEYLAEKGFRAPKGRTDLTVFLDRAWGQLRDSVRKAKEAGIDPDWSRVSQFITLGSKLGFVSVTKDAAPPFDLILLDMDEEHIPWKIIDRVNLRRNEETECSLDVSELARYNRITAIEHLAQKYGDLFEKPIIIYNGTAVETLDYLSNKGQKFERVFTTCNRDVLLWAATRGIPPLVWKFDDAGIEGDGMTVISRTLDKQLIEAFLQNTTERNVDIAAAIAAGRTDLLDLYETYGIATKLVEITDGSAFCSDNGEINIPEGVKHIGSSAFALARKPSRSSRGEKKRLPALIIPDSVESIAPYAFENREFSKVTLSKNLQAIGVSAITDARLVIAYTNIDTSSEGRINGVRIYQGGGAPDPDNGYPQSNLGYIGIKLHRKYMQCVQNSSCNNCTIEVRDPQEDQAIFRVWMPLGFKAPRYVAKLYASNWGRGATFDFSVTDPLFDELGTAENKARTAFNRLRWPIDLNDDDREKFTVYLKRNKKACFEHCLVDDDLDGIRWMEEQGLLPDIDRDGLRSMAEQHQCCHQIITYFD